MDNYIITKVLRKNQKEQIKNILDNLLWKDGLDTTFGGMSKKTKNNIESTSPELNKLIFESIDNNFLFSIFVTPKESSSCIISKMQTGGMYNPHHDSPDLGQFSTTIFLNDPKEYDGGELCLLINGKEKKIKLKFGESVTYHTGTPHRVKPVTKGERIVAVFWTKAIITDLFLRDMYYNISKVIETLNESEIFNKKSNEQDLEEVIKNPIFALRTIRENIIRKYIN